MSHTNGRKNAGKTKTHLHLNNEKIGTVKLDSGIIQGDALSPLLFVISMEPLSRMLQKKCPTVAVDETLHRNHLIFIDDIKLFAHTEEQLENVCQVTKDALEKMSMSANHSKSASNIQFNEVFGDMPTQGYKYLGVLEDHKSMAKPENKSIVKKKIQERAKKLCQTDLCAKNLFKAINEYAISLINYYVGVLAYSDK